MLAILYGVSVFLVINRNLNTFRHSIMNIVEFRNKTGLIKLTEIEKLRLIAFFYLRQRQISDFNSLMVKDWFEKFSLNIPNLPRLSRNIKASPFFVKGCNKGFFRLNARQIAALDSEFPELLDKSEEIICHDTVLPTTLYENTRGYIETIAKQINASYENNIFDGCAVLMRRLLEILLILAYKHLKIESSIMDQYGNYIPLKKIIADAGANTVLSLSKDAKKILDDFRTLGNFSAHKIYYYCRKKYIDEVIALYRVTIDEILYISGIRQ